MTIVRTKFSRVGVAAFQLVAVGEADAMDDEIEIAPLLGERGENRIQRRDVLDVAGQRKLRAETLGERQDALAQGVALVGEGELGPLSGDRLGDAPGDRMIVRDAHHEAALAVHQAWIHPARLLAVRRRRA
jgi:hypothetical protein